MKRECQSEGKINVHAHDWPGRPSSFYFESPLSRLPPFVVHNTLGSVCLERRPAVSTFRKRFAYATQMLFLGFHWDLHVKSRLS